MLLEKIDELIDSFSIILNNHISKKNITVMSSKEIYIEIYNCLLGSQVKYDMAMSYAIKISQEIDKSNVDSDKIKNVLTTPVYNKDLGNYNSYRFPNKATKNILSLHEFILKSNKTLRQIINENSNSISNFRRYLVNNINGIGPKQASHFIKNIGLSDNIAILDSHIIKYINLYDSNIVKSNNINTLSRYEFIENYFLTLVKKFIHSPAIVDQSIWFISRNGGFN